MFVPSGLGGFKGLGGIGGGPAATDFGANEAAMQQMQKAAGGGGLSGQPGQAQVPPKPPREISSFKDELLQRPATDIAEGLKLLFDLNALLGINPAVDTPEEQARKRQIHQRYQQLTQEEQQEAQRQYQQEMERKQKEELEAEEKRRREAQESQVIQAPSGQKKGPDAGGGSRKQKAVTKLQNSRKQLGGPGDVG
jgi:type IV secretory pathway VirB10-like protein